jgi:phosphoglycolate phosphatase
MAVCTNKPDRATQLVLADLGLGSCFEVVVGGDTAPCRKPDGGHLLAALGRLGASPANAAMIGDNENDAAAAHDAGLALVLMRYGYARRPIDELGADLVLDRFADLPQAIERL